MGNSLTIQWQANPVKPIPQHVLQMIVVDRNCNMLLFKRTGNTDSACNVFSMPSGRHEIGEKTTDTIHRELEEEFSLKADNIRLIGQYENIAGDPPNKPQYHWVITVYLVIVNSLDDLVNNEPDKHSELSFAHFSDPHVNPDVFFNKFNFHPTLKEFLENNAGHIFHETSYALDEGI